jgi:hypothetical protein
MFILFKLLSAMKPLSSEFRKKNKDIVSFFSE